MLMKSFFSLLTFLLFLIASIPLPGAGEWKFPLQKADELKTWDQSYNAIIANGGAQFSLGEKQRGMHGIYKTFPVSEMKGKLIRITGERRGSNLVLPERDFLGPKTMFIITCKGGQTLYPGVSGKFGTYGWEPFEALCKIPENAERIQLFLGMQNGRGTFGIRNLRIAVAGTPLNLARYGNMGYVDKTAGDGKGGWSDQGAGNDGRFFRWPHLVKNEFANVPFSPAVKDKCILTMHSNYFPAGPKQKEILLEKPEKAHFLYLMHTLCWGLTKSEPVGSITIRYMDGTSENIKVCSKVDVDDWWKGTMLSNGAIGVRARSTDGEWRSLYVSKFKLNSKSPVKSICFNAGNPKTIWIICAATLSETEYELPKPKPKVKTTIRAGKEWLPIIREEHNRRIKGSALDLSAFREPGPAGKFGRVIVRSDGHFAFERKPDQIQRFFSASTSFKLLKNRYEVDQLADELVKNGYNMIRIHIPEYTLMYGAARKLEFNSFYLDLFDYLVAALKKRGIYMMCDMAGAIMQGWNPLKIDYWGTPTADPAKHGARLAIHFDPQYRADWRKGVEQMLCRVNPYTKTRLIDDPVLAMVLGFNEQEFEFSNTNLDREYIAPFYRKFLKKKYGNIQAYNRKWNTRFSSFDAIPGFQKRENGNSDVNEFLYETERNTSEWYRQQLRELGYKGLVTSYNVFKTHHFNQIRQETCDYVAMNSYHAHPSNWIHRNSVISQESAIGKSAGLFRDIISAHLHGKPLVVTEYQCVFWNKYRYEQPFVFGAYAAFQGIDAISMHSDPVSLQPEVFSNSRIRSFGGYTDPIAVASEFLTFFLYRRGDVKTVPDNVRIQMSNDLKGVKNPNVTLSKTQSSLALITGFSLDFEGRKDPNALLISVKGGAKTAGTNAYSQSIDESANLVPYLKLMKEKGFLPKGNRSNGLNLFENSTGELLLDTDKRFMAVNTPRLQGICAEAETKYKFPDFEIASASVRGTLALVSIDKREPIRTAKRLVLVFATNALNSNMQFAEQEMLKLLRSGGTPALIQAGKFRIRLHNRNAANLKLHPLDLAGRRLKTIRPETIRGEWAEFTVDTARDGAALFFELGSE